MGWKQIVHVVPNNRVFDLHRKWFSVDQWRPDRTDRTKEGLKTGRHLLPSFKVMLQMDNLAKEKEVKCEALLLKKGFI